MTCRTRQKSEAKPLEDWGESAEAIETKRVECVDRFRKERPGFLEGPLGEKWGRKFRMEFDLHSPVYHGYFTLSINILSVLHRVI